MSESPLEQAVDSLSLVVLVNWGQHCPSDKAGLERVVGVRLDRVNRNPGGAKNRHFFGD